MEAIDRSKITVCLIAIRILLNILSLDWSLYSKSNSNCSCLSSPQKQVKGIKRKLTRNVSKYICLITLSTSSFWYVESGQEMTRMSIGIISTFRNVMLMLTDITIVANRQLSEGSTQYFTNIIDPNKIITTIIINNNPAKYINIYILIIFIFIIFILLFI